MAPTLSKSIIGCRERYSLSSPFIGKVPIHAIYGAVDSIATPDAGAVSVQPYDTTALVVRR